jgi:hypothetical protein
MNVASWLRSLGLGKYEAIFRENDIDEAVLPSLTHENLKELGVASFGHRVKLLDAIAALRGDASGKVPSIDTATASSTPSPRPEDRAERRTEAREGTWKIAMEALARAVVWMLPPAPIPAPSNGK